MKLHSKYTNGKNSRGLHQLANEWQIPPSCQQVMNMHVPLWIAFSQYEADTRSRRLFVFIWWQLTAVFPFNKIRLKKLVVHSLICHLTEGATWGRPYPIHSERLIRDSLIHRGPVSALTGCTCTKQQMGGWLVSVPEKPPLSFSFIRGPQHICSSLLSHFLFSCLIECRHKVTWTTALWGLRIMQYMSYILRHSEFLISSSFCWSSLGGIAGTRPGLANHINSRPPLRFPPARSSLNAALLTWSMRSTGRWPFS